MSQQSCRKTALRMPREWPEQVWAEAESLWLDRDGQDSYYRDHVVIPSLVTAIRGRYDTAELVDIGSGDGYCTEGLVSRLEHCGVDISPVVLLDRSRRQMNIALSRPCLQTAVPVYADLQDRDWDMSIPTRLKQRVFISVFVVQELPALGPFLRGLRRLMSVADLAILLTVAPSFSELLESRGDIRETASDAQDDDWNWRGLYPIDGAAGRFYLPHFQRSENIYRQFFDAYGLRCLQTAYLTVPANEKSSSMFAGTVYGQNILRNRSSVFFALTPGSLRGKRFP